MKLHLVQPYVLARIAAAPALAAFGAAIAYSPEIDPDASLLDIANRLRTVGVVIEVSEVEADVTEDIAHRGVAADASFDIFVAENPTVAHSPSGALLRKAVIDAVSIRLSPSDTPCKFRRSDTGKSEQGYVLRVLSFTSRITIP